MISLRSFSKICLILVAFLLSVNLGYCQDGSIESKYFTLKYYQGCDLAGLAQKLNVNYFLHLDVYGSNSRNINSVISKLLDAIYLEVSDILDIHVYSFHGTLKVVSDKSKLSDTLRLYFRKTVHLPSFYLHPKKTIYISYSDMTLGMLAHEIAHAIISHYFVVAPSNKVQEVLAGYVEYSIRKSTGTLSEIRR